jgi:hypothetical protein
MFANPAVFPVDIHPAHTHHPFYRLRFEVPSQEVSIAFLFRLMESNQAALKLEDYSISQTSLEQVFNGHAAEEDQRKKEMMKMAQRVKFL